MNKTLKRILKAVAALLIAAAVFVLGYFTHEWVRPSSMSSIEWAIQTILNEYYEEVDGDFAGSAVDSIVDDYLDKYSEYYTAEEYAALVSSNAGSKSGLGISTTYVSGEGVLINYVLGNSPAYKCGLRAGDYLTGGSFGGQTVTFSSTSDLTNLLAEADEGEEVTLYVGETAYEVAKESYTASYAILYTAETSWVVEYSSEGTYYLKEYPQDAKTGLQSGEGCIKLLQFYGGATTEFGLLLQKFYDLGCDSLYIDLRDNGGGYVSVMQEISGYFVSAGNTAMTANFRSGKTETYKVTSPSVSVSVSENTAVYLLANCGTASASEALTGVLISYGVLDYSDVYISYYGDDYVTWYTSAGGALNNGCTYGKGIMQETFINYSTGEALKLTTAKIYWPNGKCIHGVGLTAADGCNLVDAAWSVTKADEELSAVVTMVNSRA